MWNKTTRIATFALVIFAVTAFGATGSATAGDAARNTIASQYAGSTIGTTIAHPAVGSRLVDVWVDRLGLAVESKVGLTGLSPAVSKELELDQWLLENDPDVHKIEWEFRISKQTGQGGPSQKLANALDEAGVQWSEILE